MKQYIIIALTLLLSACGRTAPQTAVENGEKPTIYPDYSDVVLPSNIAPISFTIQSEANEYYAEFIADNEPIFGISSKEPVINIPLKSWSKLEGRTAFSIVIYQREDDKWSKFQPLTNSFATTPIDSYITYRLIAPGYELWDKMGIYQRNLTNFDQTEILTNTATESGCMNCHTNANHSAQTAMLHVRGSKGGTLIKRNGKVSKHSLKTPEMVSEGIYPSWHPSERFIAYSINEINQFFHTTGEKPIEVSDDVSDLVVYDIEKNEIITDPAIFGPQFMESFPEWSSDGKTLYFTRAAQLKIPIVRDSIFYDLCSVDFDVENRSFSNVKVIFEASASCKSVSFPRVIPNSDFLVFTLSDYGNFSIWHKESDLYLLNLSTLSCRAISEVNSDDTDSYHSFDSSGKWMIVSSRRDDGLYTRPYLSHFDPEKARFSKPFLLPQQQGDFYDTQFRSYNLPQFTKDSFTGQRGLLEQALSNEKTTAKFRP